MRDRALGRLRTSGLLPHVFLDRDQPPLSPQATLVAGKVVAIACLAYPNFIWEAGGFQLGSQAGNLMRVGLVRNATLVGPCCCCRIVGSVGRTQLQLEL